MGDTEEDTPDWKSRLGVTGSKISEFSKRTATATKKAASTTVDKSKNTMSSVIDTGGNVGKKSLDSIKVAVSKSLNDRKQKKDSKLSQLTGTITTSINDSVVTGDVVISQNVVADSNLCQQCSAGNVVLLKCTECPESFCELCNPLCHVITKYKICETVTFEDMRKRTRNPRYYDAGFDDGLPNAPDDTWFRFDENKGLGPFCESCKELFQIKRNDFFKIENEKRSHNKEKEEAYQNQAWNEKNKVLIDIATKEISGITKSDITRHVYNRLRDNNYIRIYDLLLNGRPTTTLNSSDPEWLDLSMKDEEEEETYLAKLKMSDDEDLISKLPKETQEYLEEFNNLIQKKLSFLDETQISEYARKNQIEIILAGLGAMVVSGSILFLLYIL